MLCSGACPVFWKPWAGRVKTSQQCPRASAEATGALLLPHSSYVVLNTTDPPGACGAGNGTNRAPEPLPSDITDTGEQSSPLLGQSQLWNHVLLTHGSQLRKLQTEQRENRAPGARSSSYCPSQNRVVRHSQVVKGPFPRTGPPPPAA